MPAKHGDPMTVRMRTPDDSRDIGTTQVFVNAQAEVIGVEQPSDKPLVARAVEALAPLHTGELGGWPLKLAWFHLCCSSPECVLLGASMFAFIPRGFRFLHNLSSTFYRLAILISAGKKQAYETLHRVRIRFTSYRFRFRNPECNADREPRFGRACC
jgi:hypothetical protein